MSLVPRNSLWDIDNFFDSFFAPGEGAAGVFAPRVDIKDKKDHYEIRADLPGVKKEDIHVTVHNGLLTLDAKMESDEKQEEGDKIIRRERRFGSYQRSFNLGPGVQESDISAQFENGVLTLQAPKAQELPPTQKKIEIK
ncbi:Hsp20/alpha crystallin family protein [Halioxenophilus sp. WMMB6]|uniref:Hsp20/alpha crystallin family protein n=1 Tax=Halioxenophilus sp. WMMB6 TaxID=3073815 RepID=UPI00295ED82F|nr:Hsp20/alpha crystallin family protein [Halioxenophilus sp. WMMB6]